MPTKKKPQKKAAEKRNLVQARPAETATGLAGAIALILSIVFNIEDAETLIAITTVISALPSFITWLVELRKG